jgi:signal transduction histidine kinase
MFVLFRSLVVLLSLLMSLTVAVAVASPVHTERVQQNLLAGALLLNDSADQLTIVDVAQADTAGRFTPWAIPAVTGSVFWLKLTIDWSANTASSRYLLLNPATIGRLDLYRFGADGHWDLRQSGGNVPLALRDIAYRMPVFHLERPRQVEQETLYLKVKSDFGVLHSVRLYDAQSFFSETFRQQLWWGVYCGIGALLILAAFLFGRVEKEYVYQWFGWYVAGCTCKALIEQGVFYQYLGTLNPVWRDFPYIVPIALVTNVIGIHLIFNLFGIDANSRPFARRFLQCCYAGSAVLLVLCLVMSSETMTMLSFFLISFVMLPMTFYVSRHVAVEAEMHVRVVYYLGLCLTILLAIEYVVTHMKIGAFTYAASMVSMTMLLLQLAIFYGISRRFYKIREDKERAHKTMLSIVENSQQQLEKRVIDKTRSLQLAMQQVQHALTEEKKTYEEQKNFIAMVSHELRTPLAVIDATAQNMARENTLQNHVVDTALMRIQMSTEYMADLVTDYLEGKSGEMLHDNLHNEWIALGPCIAEALEMIAPLATSHEIHIGQQAVPEHIYTDKALLRLMLRTLLDALLQSTVRGASVAIGAEITDDGWCIFLHVSPPAAGPTTVFQSQDEVINRHKFELVRYMAEISGGELMCEPLEQGCHRVSVVLRHTEMKASA